MNDVLLEVTKNPAARGLIKSLGLPIPLPEPLARAKGPWEALPLSKATVVVGAAAGSELLGHVAMSLAEAGASAWLAGIAGTDHDASLRAAFSEASEAHARPARPDAALDANARIDALVFDASTLSSASDLHALHEFFHERIGRLARSGRVVVLGRALATSIRPEQAAAQSALSGFVRSVAKEVGRKGATANLILVEPGAESRLGPVLRWVLERRSAFVTAQPFVVSKRAHDARRAMYVRALDGQVALVTGAARGIGRATARALASEGAHVFCVDRPEDGDETSKLAREISGTPLLLDVTASDAGSRIVAALGKKGVDIVVHNAGITRDRTLARMKAENWDLVMAVNLEAVMRITDALEVAALRDGGRVVCVSSVSGIAGNVGQSNYAASKAAIVGYVDALAARLAERGITANAVAPGFIETRMTAAIPLVIRQAGRRLSALAQGGEPEDVAAAITFLASPGAQGITGRTLRVCGGALIGA
jgi:3-oxoacyl-[acyl-carrier protein] reductase